MPNAICHAPEPTIYAPRYDYIISVLELERAVGDLDEDDIKRVNGWL